VKLIFVRYIVPPVIGSLSDQPCVVQYVRCIYLDMRGCVGSLT